MNGQAMSGQGMSGQGMSGRGMGLSEPPRLRPPEHKQLGLVAADVTLQGRFEGYASLFGVADLGGDIVDHGAFRDSLARRGPSGVRLLWQHDPAVPIGRWLMLREDGRGLHVCGQLALGAPRGREVLALLREGAVDGLSIGFRTLAARPDTRAGYRRLTRIDLWEISIVTFPLLPQARVTALKHVLSASAAARGADHRGATHRAAGHARP